MKNPYQVLGISPEATDEEVKQAYRALARKYHPDKYINNPLADLAAEKMREINEAYDFLMKNKNNQGGNYGYDTNRSYNTNSGSIYNHIRIMINESRVKGAM